jgi:hypothetical protein
MKIKRFDISVEALCSIFGAGRKEWEVRENAFPEDAEIVRIVVDERNSTPNVLSIYLTSKDFPDIPRGTLIESEAPKIYVYYESDKTEDRFVKLI